MPGRLVLDTDVLVDYLRGREPAVSFVERSEDDLFVSAITVAELFAGVRESEERDALDHFLMAFEIVSVDEELARQGGLLRGQYGPSHGTGLADALIAATADRVGGSLVTFNARHYPMVENALVPGSRRR